MQVILTVMIGLLTLEWGTQLKGFGFFGNKFEEAADLFEKASAES